MSNKWNIRKKILYYNIFEKYFFVVSEIFV